MDEPIPDEIHFDIVIYTDRAEEPAALTGQDYSGKMENVFSHISEKGIAIVNVDDIELINLLKGLKLRFVTYGFNTKASITTSSTGDNIFKDSFICCLQRTISTRGGSVIEPQEYKLRVDSDEFDNRNLLAAASFAIINGIDLNQINEI
jgi:UDP-N-acetylmuramyl tripeptide synthase